MFSNMVLMNKVLRTEVLTVETVRWSRGRINLGPGPAPDTERHLLRLLKYILRKVI